MTILKLVALVVTLLSNEFSCDSVYLLLHACHHNLIPLGGGTVDVDLLLVTLSLESKTSEPSPTPSPLSRRLSQLLPGPELAPDLVSQDLTSHWHLVPHDLLPDSLFLGAEAINALLLAPWSLPGSQSEAG